MLDSGGIMEELNHDEFYKYLGIEELEQIKHEEVKSKVNKNVKTKLRKLLETELNARNLFQAINESILPLITYSFGIINWNEDELKGIDIQIRKLLNMYRAFEIKSDVDRLYLPRECGGRGLISVWDSFQSATSRIAYAITHTNNSLLKQCVEVEKKCSYSSITRANKYESNYHIELPKNFYDKSVMAQARTMAKTVRDAISQSRSQAYLAKPQHSAFIHLLQESI